MRLYFIFLLLLAAGACSESPKKNEQYGERETTTTESPDVVNSGEAIAADESAEMDVINAAEMHEASAETNVPNEYEDIDWNEYEASMTKDYSFVILISTKNYDSAFERATEASEKLGYPLNLRGLHPHDDIGLSLPEDVCESICGGDVVDYPQYLPRKDYGESKYISVEYSNGFKGFTSGYYIVVAASGEKGAPVIKEALNEARKFYDDAYAKTCGVWMGCSC